jgi:single-stranded DNA-specific DHH superfamily exonuclease
MSREQFIVAIREGIVRLRAAGTEVALVHHNDADGLSSAAILQTALERASFSVRRICIERVHPPVVARIHDKFDSSILYVDLGTQAAPLISEINAGRRFTIILDHHHPQPSTDPEVLNIATEFYGLSGDMDIAASTAAYFFARELDISNRDLAYIAVLGAVGDAHEREGRLIKENREALEEAMQQGHVEITRDALGSEEYVLTRFSEALAVAPLAIAVTTLGGVGYYAGGPDAGIRLCLEGPTPASRSKLAELEEIQRVAYNRAWTRLEQEGFQKTEHIQWFLVGDDFAPMGVKVIGEFAWDIRDADFVDPDKYIVGFQNMAPEVPGLGTFDWSLVKVSMRLPTPLERKILVDGTMPGLSYLVPEAAREAEGSIDACHDYCAATLIPVGREGDLIAAMESLIQQELSDTA